MLPRMVLGLISSSLAAVLALATPQVLQHIVNGPLSDGGTAGLWLGVGAVALLGVLEPALLLLRRFWVTAPGTRLEAKLRVMLFRRLVDLPPEFHDQWSGGQLLTRSISDIRRFRRWLSFGSSLIGTNMLSIGVGLVLMFVTQWQLALVFLAMAVPAFFISLRSRRRYRDLARRSQDQSGDLSTTIEESVHGIRILKAFGRELEALEEFGEQAEELKTTELRKARERAFVSLLMAMVPDAALAVILVGGSFLIAAGSLTVGGLLAFFATAAVIAGPLERLSEQFTMSMEAKTSIDRFLQVLEARNNLEDPVDPQPLAAGPGRVVLRDVVVRHAGAETSEPPVLRGVDLEVLPGETLALIGVTGSGKSTLVELIPRFADVDHGSVELDGVDVRRMARAELRTAVSIAFENPILFSATVRENVALGRPDATEAELRQALEVASADFVDALPEGLDTVIGEEGLSLSGGQRQRLSLARAVAARPRVLILDDPLSALDVLTEAKVTKRLRTHLAGTTTIVVAHRPSTVALADRVALLDEGRIAAVGRHAELLGRSALYRRVIAGYEEAESA
jgi:ATP-binding cassette subfamily B protein